MLVAVTVGPPTPPVVPFWPSALTAAKPVGDVSASGAEVCAAALSLPADTAVPPSSRANARAVTPRAARNGRFGTGSFRSDDLMWCLLMWFLLS